MLHFSLSNQECISILISVELNLSAYNGVLSVRKARLSVFVLMWFICDIYFFSKSTFLRLTNVFKVDRLQIIVVPKNITVLQLFISRMPKMYAILCV